MRHAVMVGTGVVGLVLLALGHGLGLFWAPTDKMMGDVQRMMYAHVPTAWTALVAYLISFVACVGYLFFGDWTWDLVAEAAAEVGLVFNGLLLATGMIWGRPTWGVYWTWDPRLTTAGVLFLLYGGYLALRRFVDDPERRASLAAVVGILAFADAPIVYFSVRWWRGLHQIQSTPKTVDPEMVLCLRLSAFAMLFLMVHFVLRRVQIGRARLDRELAPPPAAAAGWGGPR
ncbi:cytochrome c biogenesis protein CcsA [Myxococcota bacterium]|nr:cytochrome c biogenesis protein CcsA [Myxococcota bacterium]